MQSVVRPEMTAPEPKEDKWSDFVNDLWDRKLPHFRRKGYVYSSNPSSLVPGARGESHQSSKVLKDLKDLILCSSESNIIELANEDIHVLETVPPDVSNTPEPGMTKNQLNTQFYMCILSSKTKNYSLLLCQAYRSI